VNATLIFSLSHYEAVAKAIISGLGKYAAAACGCEACVVARDSMAVRLGAILSEMMKAGRDKVTFFVSPAVASFGLRINPSVATGCSAGRRFSFHP